MKNLILALLLAFTGLVANANNEVPVNETIDIQPNMIFSEEKMSVEEAEKILVARIKVYRNGVHVATINIYIEIE